MLSFFPQHTLFQTSLQSRDYSCLVLVDDVRVRVYVRRVRGCVRSRWYLKAKYYRVASFLHRPDKVKVLSIVQCRYVIVDNQQPVIHYM